MKRQNRKGCPLACLLALLLAFSLASPGFAEAGSESDEMDVVDDVPLAQEAPSEPEPEDPVGTQNPAPELDDPAATQLLAHESDDSVEVQAPAPMESEPDILVEAQIPAPAAEGDEPAEEDGPTSPLVAIIDTGCDPALCENTVTVIGGDPSDTDGHGTSVARMVLGQNPDARILSIKALDSEGKGSSEAICAALRYAIDNGTDIVNMSFSSYAPEGIAAIEALVEEAQDKGMAIVAAAGNDGGDAALYCPAQIEGVITVGAIDLNGNLLESSNAGDAVDVWITAESTSYAAAIASGRLSLTGRGISWLESLIGYGDIDLIETVPLETDAPESEEEFITAFTHATLQCRFHISYIGNTNWMTLTANSPTRTQNTSMTSSTFGNYVNGLWQHIENVAFKVIRNNAADGGITYRAYYQDTGYDSGWRSNGTFSPTATGNGKAVEGIEVKLTGNLASCYNITYKVYTSDSNENTKEPMYHNDSHIWHQASNGGYAGTKNKSLGIEDVRMWLTPKSYTHTVQVRYQNADGSYGGWSNVRSGSYAYGSTVPAWSRSADSTYNAASMAAYTAGYATTTQQVSITRRTATNTIQVRYQNADGSYGSYSNASSGSNRVGETRSWSRAEDGTYNAASASIACTCNAQTKQVSVTRKSYYLDVNGLLDGVSNGGCGSMGTFDFNVNGSQTASDAADYYATSLAGSTWSITDIKAKPGYTYDGIAEGSTSGTLGTTNTQAARLKFHTNTYTVAFDGNGASEGSMASEDMTCNAAATLNANGFTRTNYVFTGWNTAPDGSGTSYADGQSVTNLTLSDKATVTLYAQWEQMLALPQAGSDELGTMALAAMLCLACGALALRLVRRNDERA